MKFGWSDRNSQGTCPMVRATSPEDSRSIPKILLEAALDGVNVPNHIRSHQLKNEVWPICLKLTGDLPHGRGCLPWRWQVLTTIPQGAVQVWVNVPNYVWSCQLCTTLVNLGELGCSAPWLKFPWKLNLGRSAWNSQGTCPWPRTTFPEDGKSLALSSKEQARHE